MFSGFGVKSMAAFKRHFEQLILIIYEKQNLFFSSAFEKCFNLFAFSPPKITNNFVALTTVVAVSACTIGADLRMIPNQPIVFKVDMSSFFIISRMVTIQFLKKNPQLRIKG